MPAQMHTNRLIHETSPYLLQHAHNPVEWRAWGTEAFEAARAQDRPVFLSIGYSTCYWCHVMERECFESEEIARVMNEHFICIKVDREERPDVDDIYMAAVQMTTGSGGWPMSVFLESRSLKPFVAGTYFPPEDRHGLPAFPRVLTHIAQLWRTQRDAVLEQADHVASAVKEHLSRTMAPAPVGQKQVDGAVAQLMASYDPRDGGFTGSPRRAPKFPTPANLDFLIGAAWGDDSVRRAVLHTLDRMAIGGMYDQIGGGFHRYSVDEQWLVPHFEKMLYDQGQLAATYARAYELTNDQFYAETLGETLEYVLREMAHPQGGFLSAQDAEVDAREGDNYVWTKDQIRDALMAPGLAGEVDFALRVHGLKEGPNFRDPHHADAGPVNVLFLSDKPAALARRESMSADDFNARLRRINQTLLSVRNQRKQPRTDDKILAGWNGLMISGMAEGGRVLKQERFLDAAARAASFVLTSMQSHDGGLLRTWRDGNAKIDAFLEDYSLFIRGLLALHRATGDRSWLDRAIELAWLAKSRFWDSLSGGFFDTLERQSDLFVRVKSMYDGAVPCGNSVMLHNLLDLHERIGDVQFLNLALDTLKSMSGGIDRQPTGPVLATLALKRIVDQHSDRLNQPAPEHRSNPVEILVAPTTIHLGANGAAEVVITLRMAEGYHINAHEPGVDNLVPLYVQLVSGSGISMDVNYPKAERLSVESTETPINIHSAQANICLLLRRTGPVNGRPRLALTYQACTDRQCLAPVTHVLPVAIVNDA